MSRQRKGKNTGEDNPMYGRRHTAEAKMRMAELHLKENLSEETRKKISKKAKDRLSIPENNPRYGVGTPVVQLDANWNFISKYITTREAERCTGVHHSSISRSCKHKGHKFAGEFRWMYLEDYEQPTTQND